MTYLIKPVERKVLMKLNSNGRRLNISGICRSIDTTYSHIISTIKVMEKKRLVNTSKEGRDVFVTLTKKGYDVLQILIKLEKLCN